MKMPHMSCCTGSVILISLFVLCMPVVAPAQVSMGKQHTEYAQGFNTLPVSGNAIWADGTSFIPSWTVHRSVTTDQNITAGTGSNNTGGLYSYGGSGSSERALGSITSLNAGEFTYNLLLQNTSGVTIQSLDISYYGEQWRSGSVSTAVQSLTFWYAIASEPAAFNPSPRSDKDWIEVPALHFRSVVNRSAGGALNGNAPANRALMTAILSIDLPNEYYVMLRWKDADEPEMDHGLAIDDVKVRWTLEDNFVALPVTLLHFKPQVNHNSIILNWATATETDNDHFAIERSSDGKHFQTIGRVSGGGTTTKRSSYMFEDTAPLFAQSYYRLKQTDTYDRFTYSAIVSVIWIVKDKSVPVYPTVATDFLYIELPQKQDCFLITILSQTGQKVFSKSMDGVSAIQKLNVSSLRRGTYFLVLQDSKGNKNVKRFQVQ